MSRNRTARIEGLENVQAALARMSDRVRRGLVRAVEQSVAAVEADTRDSAPVRSGQLSADGIGSRILADGLAGEVGFTRDEGWYGHMVEFGTSHSPAQPMLTPAAEAERARFPDRVRTEVRREFGA